MEKTYKTRRQRELEHRKEILAILECHESKQGKYKYFIDTSILDTKESKRLLRSNPKTLREKDKYRREKIVATRMRSFYQMGYPPVTHEFLEEFNNLIDYTKSRIKRLERYYIY